MILNIVLLIVATTKTQGFILSLGTQAPPGPKAFDPNCKDVIDSCWKMPEENCRAPYEEWARQNCANRCGYCIGPTTPAPPCVNKLPNCEIYEKSVCTNPDYKTWAADNCRYYCRLCSQSELNRLDAITTTVRPEDCVDKVDCRQYGTNACSAAFKGWSEDNCPNYCGYCTGLPTPPPVCEDKIPNCMAYNKDTCTNTDYRLWVMDNCQKYCGLCGGSGQPATKAPPLPGRDVPVINYTPPVPKPGKRAVSEKSKREFEASHHHGGTPTCWDGDASNPSCVTAQPDVGGSTVDTIIGGNFPGSEYKPHPTPEAGWDHKPNTTTVKTKPPVTTSDPTTTTTQAQTVSTIESITTTTTAVPPTIATDTPTRVPTEEVTTTTTEMPTTPSIKSTTTTEPATDATIEVTTTTELPTSSSMLLDTTTTTAEPVTETSSSTTTTTELPTTQTVFVETTTTNPPTKVETSATTTTTGAPPTDTKVPSPTSTLQTTPQPVSSSAAATTQAPPKTTQPPAPTTTGLVTTAAACADKIDNCGTYGKKICTTELYKPWATARCSAFCGFCTVVTLTPFNCADKIDNCAEFDGGNLCTDESYYVWAHENCFNYCGFPPCGNNTETVPPNSGVSEITATEMVSTTPATTGNNTCVDKADNCMSLSDDKCFGVYAAWARSHCGLRCGYCGVLPCEDRTDCAAYPSEICTSAEYENWTRSNCRKFCNWCGRPTPPPASTQEASTTVSVQDTTANGLP